MATVGDARKVLENLRKKLPKVEYDKHRVAFWQTMINQEKIIYSPWYFPDSAEDALELGPEAEAEYQKLLI